jgi:hypothetical protein
VFEVLMSPKDNVTVVPMTPNSEWRLYSITLARIVTTVYMAYWW